MTPLLLLSFIAGASPDADAVAALALAKVARERSPTPQVAAPNLRGYPVHNRRWTYPGEIHSHLIAEHGSQFPTDWLRGLSKAEAEALHDDVHEGKVQWGYVPKVQRSAPPVVRAPVVWLDCPPGSTH